MSNDENDNIPDFSRRKALGMLLGGGMAAAGLGKAISTQSTAVDLVSHANRLREEASTSQHEPAAVRKVDAAIEKETGAAEMQNTVGMVGAVAAAGVGVVALSGLESKPPQPQPSFRQVLTESIRRTSEMDKGNSR